ncbi:MAG: tetratricopeptide repeat protein [Deltaproteobacteria bacterium]|nr:tetratricopeptide repeat protein [Deltaproteobacteria bacterium]
MTAELGRAIAGMAEGALAEDRLRAARDMLEGLVVTNPRDPVAWALLSTVCRRQGHAEAARLCAEAAVRLAPDDPQARLARAETQLLWPAERAAGCEGLRALAVEPGGVGERARALLAAIGPTGTAG